MIKICLICTKDFETFACKIAQGRGKYCSRRCYEVSKQGKPSWNKGKSNTWAIGNKYRLGKSNLNPHRMVGEENPKWKGGITVGIDNRQKYFLEKRHERRARIVSVGGEYSSQEWENLKKKYSYTCLGCKRREPEIKLTLDHVVPIINGGSNFIENIQPLCKSCNSKKHTKETDYRNC
jgi:5-methylcytosine-specific restriction endonuclease McrA